MNGKKFRTTLCRAAAFMLAVCILSTSVFAAEGFGNFAGKRTYRSNLFSDVNEFEWYGVFQQGVIKSAYEFGLMEGNTDGTFAPTDNVLICQIITMAARIHNIYYGGTGVFPAGDPWYTPYVNYALENGIIDFDDSPYDYEAVASRALVADIFAHSLPDSALQPLTTIASLPDVTRTGYCGESIFKLYEAGVLRGSDEAGTFWPYKAITRAETAAIACRLVAPELREALSPQGELIPGYTDDAIVNYFVEVAFGSEYGGKANNLRKWRGPIYVEVSGDVTYEDWLKMDELFAALNSVEGFPGIYYASEQGKVANLRVYYAPPSDFDEYANIPDTNLWGYAQYNYYTSTHQIYKGLVLLPSEEANQWYRNSIICEELVQILGLLCDSWEYPDSIFYQNSNDTQFPSELDWVLVRLLYSPSMPLGATVSEAREIAHELIDSWK